jgi:arginyl-tRNA synthetase
MYIISACLLGRNCKYNGGNNRNEEVISFAEKHSIVEVCPETAGGLRSPRCPAERTGSRVISRDGRDLTGAFERGAQICLEHARRAAEASGEQIEGAVLKANSPSCGCGHIYDGTFTGRKIPGYGCFAEKLKELGIKTVTEEYFERKKDQMVDFKKKIAEEISAAVDGLTPEDAESLIEIPQDKTMGDYAFPCFRLAKTMRMAPPLIAKGIAEKLDGSDLFEKVQPVNAYVNMFLSKSAMTRETLGMALKGDDFGRQDIGHGKTIIVEYSSPNIAKPFHIGHIRSTVIGNSIYKIFDELGYKVMRLNHLGDYGTQFGKMIVAYRKWGNEEDVKKEPIKTLLSYYTKFHVEAEKDPSLDDEAREAFTKLENGDEEEVKLWKWFKDESLKEFMRVYKMLDIDFDWFDGESFYSDKMQRFIDELNEKGLLKKSQGANVVDLEEYGLGTALITKSDGSSLYCTRDIATAVYRKEHFDFYKNIYVVASQQNLYFKQLKKILELLGYDWAEDCVHVPFGMVSLESGTMSTRQGRVVFLEDVLNRAVEKTREIIKEKNPDLSEEEMDDVAQKVGIGAVVFNELSNNRIKDYVFKWDKVLNFDGETGPYVQYTHARCASVLRKAGEDTVKKASDVSNVDFSYISSDAAYELTKLIYGFPQVIVDAADKYEPSMITRHIINVAEAYNRFYHDEHILVDDEAERTAKVALTIAAKNTIKNGLTLLGVKSPDRM